MTEFFGAPLNFAPQKSSAQSLPIPQATIKREVCSYTCFTEGQTEAQVTCASSHSESSGIWTQPSLTQESTHFPAPHTVFPKAPPSTLGSQASVSLFVKWD